MNDNDRHDLKHGIQRLRAKIDAPPLPRIFYRIVDPPLEPGGEPILGELLDEHGQVVEERGDGPDTTLEARVTKGGLSSNRSRIHDTTDN